MVREFTPEEETKITELRSKLSDISPDKVPLLLDDYYLIRWLRARNLDIPKAETMLRTSLKWREKNKVDGILDRPEDAVPLKYRQMYPTANFGQDDQANPILCLPLGRANYRIVLEEVGMEELLKYNIIWMETAMKIIADNEAELGKKGLQLIEIIDCEQLSLQKFLYKPSRDFLVETQKVMEANYPEILKSMLIINAPKIFAMVFKLLKPLLPQETLDKMDVYGQDEVEWKNVIGERFSLDGIPSRWGGTHPSSSEKDPFCSQDISVWPDGPIPLSFFTEDTVDENGFKKTKIGARDKFKMEMKIKCIGSELRWDFSTEGHDIGFEIVAPHGKPPPPVPWSRLDSHHVNQQGSIRCDNVGTYILIFDNTFSYTKSKILKYFVQVVEPHELQVELEIDMKSKEEEEKTD